MLKQNTFYEFFAGGGMARAALMKNDWACLFSNDFDFKKSKTYIENWGDSELVTKDIKDLQTSEIPDIADLVWASFPCQDLSLAGGGAGLKGDRSGTFWSFWNLIKQIAQEQRAPNIVVLENVCGALTSHNGDDFKAICSALKGENYNFGAIVVDASLFVPQSRPRLFIIATRKDIDIPQAIVGNSPTNIWHTKALKKAHGRLPLELKNNWIWWDLPVPTKQVLPFSEIIEDNPTGVEWHSDKETDHLVSMMSDVNLNKLKEAQSLNSRQVGTIYKRTRLNADGLKVQRAEVRFDDVAGCLRTPSGGSSRQLIIVVEGDCIKTRLISTRETARLMGLSDNYKLPQRYNEAYHLTGDGVVVPVVQHLDTFIFTPLIENLKKSGIKVA